MCARRKEAFGYDGDKFELEDFAAENCEYVGSVCYGCAGRGGEGRVGGKEGGGKGPLRGIDIPRRRRRRPRLLLSPLLLLLLPLISTLAEAERRESFDSLSLSANPSFSLFFPSRREDRSKPPCLHRDAMICQINRFPPFFRPLLPPLIPALDFAISTLPPSLEGGGREGGRGSLLKTRAKTANNLGRGETFINGKRDGPRGNF